MSRHPQVSPSVGRVHVAAQDYVLCRSPKRSRLFLGYPDVYVPEGDNEEIVPVPRGTRLEIVAVYESNAGGKPFCYPLVSFIDQNGRAWERVNGEDLCTTAAADEGPVFFGVKD